MRPFGSTPPPRQPINPQNISGPSGRTDVNSIPTFKGAASPHHNRLQQMESNRDHAAGKVKELKDQIKNGVPRGSAHFDENGSVKKWSLTNRGKQNVEHQSPTYRAMDKELGHWEQTHHFWNSEAKAFKKHHADELRPGSTAQPKPMKESYSEAHNPNPSRRPAPQPTPIAGPERPSVNSGPATFEDMGFTHQAKPEKGKVGAMAEKYLHIGRDNSPPSMNTPPERPKAPMRPNFPDAMPRMTPRERVGYLESQVSTARTYEQQMKDRVLNAPGHEYGQAREQYLDAKQLLTTKEAELAHARTAAPNRTPPNPNAPKSFADMGVVAGEQRESKFYHKLTDHFTHNDKKSVGSTYNPTGTAAAPRQEGTYENKGTKDEKWIPPPGLFAPEPSSNTRVRFAPQPERRPGPEDAGTSGTSSP